MAPTTPCSATVSPHWESPTVAWFWGLGRWMGLSSLDEDLRESGMENHADDLMSVDVNHSMTFLNWCNLFCMSEYRTP